MCLWENLSTFQFFWKPKLFKNKFIKLIKIRKETNHSSTKNKYMIADFLKKNNKIFEDRVEEISQKLQLKIDVK